jgi:tetratricopeptide (TPR) repeat protein
MPRSVRWFPAWAAVFGVMLISLRAAAGLGSLTVNQCHVWLAAGGESVEASETCILSASAHAPEITWRRAAQLNVASGRLVAARSYLERAARSDPLAWWTLGLAAWDQGDGATALAAWTRLVGAQPRALYNVIWRIQTGPYPAGTDRSQVVQALALTAVARDATYLYPHFVLAEAYLAAGDLTAARAEYEQVLKLSPASTLARERLDALDGGTTAP